MRSEGLFEFPLTRWGLTDTFDGPIHPAVDLYEDEKNVYAKVELPGITKEDIDVSVENDVLAIKGEKKTENEEKKKNFYRLERSYGTFLRAISLPHGVDTEKTKASYKNGVLELTLPKKEGAKASKINIE